MIVTYSPDGQAEPTTWVIDLDDFRSSEMEQIEKLTKLDFGSEFILSVMRKGALARRALLFILLSRDHGRRIRFDAIDFSNKQLLVEMDKGEWAAERKKLEESTKIPEAEKTERLAVIDQLLADAPEAPGKAPAPSAGSGASTD
jgi:hypothetical protein